MAEYETKQGKAIPLVMPSGNGAFTVTKNIATLLPFQFEAEGLKKG
jgi:ABC-type iron transport system FetAB ATPase subunit